MLSIIMSLVSLVGLHQHQYFLRTLRPLLNLSHYGPPRSWPPAEQMPILLCCLRHSQVGKVSV